MAAGVRMHLRVNDGLKAIASPNKIKYLDPLSESSVQNVSFAEADNYKYQTKHKPFFLQI